MKLGLISDIHADGTALQQALDALDGHGVDRILCAGDLVERGEDGEKVIDTIRKRNIPCVKGNHDERAVTNQRWLRANASELSPFADDRLLSLLALDYLASLPNRLILEVAEKRLLLAHGTPWSNVQYIFPAMDETYFERIRQEFKVDFVILGHTHMPMEITYHKMKLLNPGSVSRHDTRHGSNTYGILTLPEGKFEVYHLPYRMSYQIPRLQYP